MNIDVSVVLISYNHEPFISQAINSVLSQLGKLSIEIIIHDDCSTDNSEEIIKKFSFADARIVPILESENQYSKKNLFFLDLFKRCRGKYICCLECDDYWCDNHKLEKQFTFMENNEDISLLGHMTYAKNIDGKPVKNTFLNGVKEGYYDIHDVFSWRLFAHFSSLFFRNVFKEDKYSLYFDALNDWDCPTDRSLPVLLLKFGKLYVMGDYMSVYRFQSSPSSFTANVFNGRNINYVKLYNESIAMERILKNYGYDYKFGDRNDRILYEAFVSYKRRKCTKQTFLSIKELHGYSFKDFIECRLYLIKKVFSKLIRVLRRNNYD